MKRGIFISLEGGEGAGKTTLAKALQNYCENRGREVVLTREPGGTQNGESVRRLLVEGARDRWSAMSETLLLYAARLDHVERLIVPALQRGAIVICDRFSDSTKAYQGVAGGVDTQSIDTIHKTILKGFN